MQRSLSCGIRGCRLVLRAPDNLGMPEVEVAEAPIQGQQKSWEVENSRLKIAKHEDQD